VTVAKGTMTIKMLKASDPRAAKAVEAAKIRARLEPLRKERVIGNDGLGR
jgi:hypothetical protein